MSHTHGTSSSVQNTPLPALPAPLYITVGPQCAGKTTFLSSLKKSDDDDKNSSVKNADLVDICIDDQEGVYHPVPLSCFLDPNSDTNIAGSTVLYNKTIKQLITCPTNAELRIVLHHLHNTKSNDDTENAKISLKKALTDIAKQHGRKFEYADDLLEDLVTAILDTHRSNGGNNPPSHRENIDLFVPDAIFRAPALALQKALHHLNSYCRSDTDHGNNNIPIAWGNTNTRPREYETALEYAQAGGRPVHFVLFDVDNNGGDCRLQLPHAARSELLRRNVQRLWQTGRYVGTKAIADALQRCQQLLQQSRSATNTTSSATVNMDTEVGLSRLAGYDMDPVRRTVKRTLGNNGGDGSGHHTRNNNHHHYYNRGGGAGRGSDRSRGHNHHGGGGNGGSAGRRHFGARGVDRDHHYSNHDHQQQRNNEYPNNGNTNSRRHQYADPYGQNSKRRWNSGSSSSDRRQQQGRENVDDSRRRY